MTRDQIIPVRLLSAHTALQEMRWYAVEDLDPADDEGTDRQGSDD